MLSNRDKTSGSNEWYTPAWLHQAASEVMGGIDTDPASNCKHNPNVPATVHYNQSDNGLTKDWFGRVFVNPPWSGPTALQWVNKAVKEYSEGRASDVVFVFRAVGLETRWAQTLLGFPVCFLKGRVDYHPGGGQSNTAPTQGTMVIYLGPNLDGFEKVFGQLGRVMFPAG